jgi:hypothetical protein
MSTHPKPDLEERAKTQADSMGDDRPDLWWQEYRQAYAQAAGVYNEPQPHITKDLQAYLRKIDKKVRSEQQKWRKSKAGRGR